MSSTEPQPIQSPETCQRVASALLAHRERLWRLVHFRLHPQLRDRVDAEDILQEAYLAACHRAEHLPEDGTQYLWLRLVVLQTLADVYRRHLRAQKRSVTREVKKMPGKTPTAASVSIVRELLAHLTSPSQAAVREEMGQQLREAIDAMGEIDAEVLALRHFEEMTNQEVADVLRITPKAASIRYVRALRRLKDLVAQIPGLEIDAFGR